MAATFLRSEERSLVERVPAVFDRASLFRPGFVHPVLWWVLLAGWLVALPFGLARALSATWAEES